MKKIHFKTVLFILFCFSVPVMAQEDCFEPEDGGGLFGSSVGYNYLFSDNGEVSKIDGIGAKFRQFTYWRNGGFGAPANYPYDATYPNRFDPNYTYSFGNFLASDIINTLESLKNDTESPVEMFYPVNAASANFLGTNFSWNPANSIWNMDTQQAEWRKPVPFVIDTNEAISSENFIDIFCDGNDCWDFDEPESYRFFAEYLSYYVGLFGESNRDINNVDIEMPSYFNYGASMEPVTGLKYNSYMELWNEPDSWWTWPNNFGYFEPNELAAFCHAAIGGNAEITTTFPTTDSDGNLIVHYPQVGVSDFDSSMKFISPSPHEMDLDYFTDFMSSLRVYRPGFNFHVNAFHHYSAYDGDQLAALISPDPNDGISTRTNIINASLTRGTMPTTHDYRFGNEVIETVQLEATPNLTTSYWICPELDGYKERGGEIRRELDLNNILGDIWITEWGYPSTLINSAQYPIGLNPEETQARWLMRGFLEYGASHDISASMWHWLQDGGEPSWDQQTGILDVGGGRKTSWYYIHTMMTEIGDKSLFDELTLSGCDTDYIPSINIDNGVLEGVNPVDDMGNEINCPRIYKYGIECCPNEDVENYEESTWVVWFPYMVNKEGIIQVELGDLAIQGEPHSFYTVEPMNGLVDGYTSPLLAVNYPFGGTPFIQLPISEKPIFLHFVGERVCENGNPGTNPGNNCSYSISASGESDATCTSISFEVSIQNSCPELATITNLIVTGSSENDYDIFSSTNNIGANSATITINGLIPGESYDFTIGAEFQVGVEYGYITDVIGGLSTLPSDECFTGMILDGDGDAVGYGFNCNSASIEIAINSVDGDVSSFGITSTLTQTDLDFNAVSSGIPLDAVPSLDWEGDAGNYTTTINMPSISPGSCYQLSLNFTDALGNIYGDTEIVNFCADNCGDSNPEAVTDIITNTCEEICFLPTTFIDNMSNVQCVLQYRLEIRDQEGNYADVFLPLSEGDCQLGSPICFDLNNLSTTDQEQIDMLGSPPYVAQIVSIFSGPATNGPQFDIGLCCDDTEFKPDLIVNKQCYNSNAYVYFCLDEIESCLNTSLSDIDIRVVGVENGYLNGASLNTTFEGWNGEDNCYSIHLRSYTKPVCENISFTVLLNAVGTDGEPIEISFSHTLNYEGCCQVAEPAPEPPIRENMRVLTSVNNEDGSIFLSGKITEYRDVLLESRKINHPIRYVLRDKKEQIIDYREYSDGINLLLPKGYETYRELNENYSIHLLASNSIYEVSFPEDIDKSKSNLSESFNLRDTQIRESIELFPNPTNNKVRILLSSKQDNSILSIYDMQGKRYLSKKISDMHTELDVSKFPDGVYFVEVVQLGGIIVREKLVIQ